MSKDSYSSRAVTLSLSRAEAWTLHHVLLDWLEQGDTMAEPSQSTTPPVEVVTAFETIDAGQTSFTSAQLDAIQPILAEYHHAPAWEFDRARLEQLLYRVTDQRDQSQRTLPSD